MNLLLIANPMSGGDVRSWIARATERLRALGASIEPLLTEKRGDGTLNEIANGLHGSALPAAFMPLGTVNGFAL